MPAEKLLKPYLDGTNIFLSLKIYEALMQKDMDEEKRARVIAEGFAELESRYPNLTKTATKDDVEIAKLDLEKQIEQVKKEIQTVKLELQKEIEEVRKEVQTVKLELQKEIEEVRKEIQIAKNDTIKWFVMALTAQTGIIFGLLKFFN